MPRAVRSNSYDFGKTLAYLLEQPLDGLHNVTHRQYDQHQTHRDNNGGDDGMSGGKPGEGNSRYIFAQAESYV